MLQSIRDHTQGWIAGVIVSLLILSFAIWGISSYFGGNAGNSTVATVNGVDITRGQLSAAYERLRRQLQTQYNSPYELPEGLEANLKDKALQALINIQVLQQASLQDGFRVSSGQVDSYLENMPEFQVDGQFSIERLRKLLQTTLYTPSDFLDIIKTNLLIEQPRLGVIFTSYALPNEVKETIALVNQERSFQYLLLPINKFQNQSVSLSSDKTVNYYKEHESEFKTPEQVTVEYVELSLKDLMSKIEVNDEMLNAFYKENANAYAEPAQWQFESIFVPFSENATTAELSETEKKANEIFAKAKEGQTFSALKKSYSVQEDPKLTGNVSFDKIPAELQQAVNGLTKENSIHQPIKLSNGYIILKLMDFKKPVVKPFEQVKNKVAEGLKRQLAEEKFAEMREKLSNLAYEHPESLEQVANSLNLSLKVSESFTKDSATKDIAAHPKIREAAFSNDVLSLRNNSEVIQPNLDTAVVLRIKTHSPATLLPFETVQKQIVDKLTTKEIETKAQNTANEIKQKLFEGVSPNEIAKQYNASWANVDFIGRHSTKVDSAILDTVFEMPRVPVKSLPDNMVSYAVAKVPNGYAIIGLKNVKDGALKEDHEQYRVFAEQLQNTQGLMEYELYKQSQMQQAKIVLNN